MFFFGNSQATGMVMGIGIDLVKVDRLSDWIDSTQKLSKVFTNQEMLNCMHELGPDQEIINTENIHQVRTAYWAVRFAAKEAFYKALSNTLIQLKMTQNSFSFISISHFVEIKKGTWEVPFLEVNWYALEQKIGAKLPPLRIHLSLSHEREYAIAQVIITMQE